MAQRGQRGRLLLLALLVLARTRRKLCCVPCAASLLRTCGAPQLAYLGAEGTSCETRARQLRQLRDAQRDLLRCKARGAHSTLERATFSVSQHCH